ncbi:MAG: hypothetical protein PHQ66_01685 [Candidatus Nanoarchaeia archaeon]|nr:hypothetical protein [Candidatus Nanoarchaeia archaeon]MDD5357914.1 hypothetical protein [Candidatus Nanoarchaeia archaeon]MDD5588833.1 hypothetical protein [Candidatus Nanoarchaeia archaeon]
MTRKKGMKKTARRNLRKKGSKYMQAGGLQNKIKLVINNLLLFVALSLISFVLYRFIENSFLNDLFFIIAIVFGFIGVGFLIVLLILMIMNLMSKRR